jgi:uncharacterized protein with GYD domain
MLDRKIEELATTVAILENDLRKAIRSLKDNESRIQTLERTVQAQGYEISSLKRR